MIRFRLDENIDGAIARALRDRGIDATTAGQAGLLSASDEEHLAFALAEHRVLVTHDADFLRLHASGMAHAGIAFCHAEARTIGQIVRSLVLIHECLTEAEMEGRVRWL